LGWKWERGEDDAEGGCKAQGIWGGCGVVENAEKRFSGVITVTVRERR
jgi:hypothetical protein